MSGQLFWKYPTSSKIQSSPTVVNGTLFVGSTDGTVYALEAETGRERWQFTTDDTVVSSPTVVDKTVFVGSDDGNVYALNAASGERQWHFETGESVQSSPTVADQTVFVKSNDGIVYALNATSGESQWRYKTTGSSPQSPVVVDGTLYIGTGTTGSSHSTGSVTALDISTGQVQWRFEPFEFPCGHSSLTVSNYTLFVGTWILHADKSKQGYVHALEPDTGDERWRVGLNGWVESTTVPTVAKNTLFTVTYSEKLHAIDISTGKNGMLTACQDSNLPQ
ncbi:pyrrolo-quinoline quinone [Halorubrum sp. GN11_10-6_MGM]|uniref:outer membrane protein assembly factor BamB family protein n=1 Tax=Halorubrum sp. GN11_10-6_MGM TaxID=2518112 RepID=UPI0010F95B09|nr:PQQ-binding-like beta-propeller repeat protein [Halorubrum sp. GN11_10-6_MGM]TKX74224.1 pyrrolo-quinoline quinone [Halorubrum sp. GN11_10-6_MGM]